MNDRNHITAAILADAQQDMTLAAYAEHGGPVNLATAIVQAREILTHLGNEAERIGRPDLASIAYGPAA